jgi:hypothetical protein
MGAGRRRQVLIYRAGCLWAQSEKIPPGEWIFQARAPRSRERQEGRIRLERRVEDSPEQPIKPLLMVSEDICSSPKPISRLSEAEITGALAV